MIFQKFRDQLLLVLKKFLKHVYDLINVQWKFENDIFHYRLIKHILLMTPKKNLQN